MNNFINAYFGPLPREYCMYFYVLSLIFGFAFFVSLFGILGFIIFNYKKVNTTFLVNSTMLLLNMFLAYIANRLLNTMCIKVL